MDFLILPSTLPCAKYILTVVNEEEYFIHLESNVV